MVNIELIELRLKIGKTAKELDISHPGWQRLINREILDLGNSKHCIAGQLN